MKVLLDECVDTRLAAHIGGFEVATVAGRGWTGITNGKLLALAQAEFDVFVTVDRNLSFQQHLPKFDIAVVLVRASSNRLADLVLDFPGFSGHVGVFVRLFQIPWDLRRPGDYGGALYYRRNQCSQILRSSPAPEFGRFSSLRIPS